MNLDVAISDAPCWNGRKTAALASPIFDDLSCASAFVHAAEKAARDRGYEAVVGPMAGDTWGAYRALLWSDGSPGFLGEPKTGPYDLEGYLKCGFEIVETHFSAVAASGSRGFAAAGSPDVTVSELKDADPAALLSDAHGVVMAAFAKTPFFRPISRERFVAAYLPVFAAADPRFVLIAREPSGRAVGFTLAYPDPLRKGAIVLKTYAALVPGIGRRMADMVHATAAEAGFPEVVHALMREGIISAAQSRKFGGRPIRRYALMGKLL